MFAASLLCDAARCACLSATADPCHACKLVLNAGHFYSFLPAAIWSVIAVDVTSSLRISKPNPGFLSKTEMNQFRTVSVFFGGN